MDNKYLEPRDFHFKYKLGNKISSGAYGSVYESGNHAVKVQKSFETTSGKDSSPRVHRLLRSTIREIDMYSRFDHPCIIKIVNWSIEILTNDNIISYMVLEKGESISSAYQSKKITTDEICRDILSAISFLHMNFVCHKDIKPDNIIYLNNRAVLIDFGIASDTIPVENFAVVSGAAFTPNFRDPEYRSSAKNKDTCDEYAFGISLYCLLKNIPYVQNYPHIPGITLNEKFVTNLIRDCIEPVERRLTASKLLEKYGFENVIGSALETPVPMYDKTCGKANETIIEILFIWMTDVYTVNSFSLKSLFLAFHLFHRSIKFLIPNFATNVSYIQLVAICCIYLSTIDEDNSPNPTFLIYHTANAYTIKQFYNMLIETLKVLHGIITTDTYWWYAENDFELTAYFLENFSCSYNLDRIKNYQKDTTEHFSKDITTRTFIHFSTFGEEITTEQINLARKSLIKYQINKNYISNERKIIPIELNDKLELKVLEELIINRAELLKDANPNISIDYLNSILHYAKRFKDFSSEGGNKLYNLLCRWKESKTALRWYYLIYKSFNNIDGLPREYANDLYNPFAASTIKELIETSISPIAKLVLKE